jgi:hypothetical protein
MKEKEMESSGKKLIQVGLHSTTVISIDKVVDLINEKSGELGNATRTSAINAMFRLKTPEQVYAFLIEK